MRYGTMAVLAVAMVLSGCDALPGSNQASTTEAPAKGDASADAGGSSERASETASNLDPLLANPQVGDVWAADLTHFSAADFNREGGTQAEAFGQVKIVEVSDDRVTVVTEDSAWPDADGARRELRDRSAVIRWDESERIPVNRAEFAQLVEDEKILETRR